MKDFVILPTSNINNVVKVTQAFFIPLRFCIDY